MSEKGLFSAISGFFKDLKQSSEKPNNTSAPTATSGGGKTSVADYIAQQESRTVTGTAKYIAKQDGRALTGVARYTANLDA